MKILRMLLLSCYLTLVSGCATAVTWETGTGHQAKLLPPYSHTQATETHAKARPQYLLLLPVAVPVDVLTFPIQVPFWFMDDPFIDG
jgi:uncharacterized protein YceK